MENKRSIKEIMNTKSDIVKNIISKALNIENKYMNRKKERGMAVDEIVEMIKNEVK